MRAETQLACCKPFAKPLWCFTLNRFWHVMSTSSFHPPTLFQDIFQGNSLAYFRGIIRHTSCFWCWKEFSMGSGHRNKWNNIDETSCKYDFKAVSQSDVLFKASKWGKGFLSWCRPVVAQSFTRLDRGLSASCCLIEKNMVVASFYCEKEAIILSSKSNYLSLPAANLFHKVHKRYLQSPDLQVVFNTFTHNGLNIFAATPLSLRAPSRISFDRLKSLRRVWVFLLSKKTNTVNPKTWNPKTQNPKP